ncbi:hypothetical protein [Sphingobacterium sp. HMA12]|uniref:hypothetical protein n=1 Tax=Sphingobacterium sp. HMA12 TaxID=2050894 RepID=UPI000CE9D4BA|nr:hypothetical protein [Sphingobacterium sp. HMA12]
MFDFAKDNSNFPKENDKNRIWLDGDRLHYLDHGNEENVNLSKLRYAYVQLLAGDPYLFLFDDHQHYIPASSQGFSKVYPKLSEQFGFDDALFFHTVKQQLDCKAKIWIQQQPHNYKVLPGEFEDDHIGFEVYAEPTQFISWNITYADLEKLGIGHQYTSEYGTVYFKIDYPVRIGSLWLKELEIYCDDIPPLVPIQEYFTTVYDRSNTDKSYKDLRNLWFDDEDYKVEDYGYEREDQCYLSFDFGDDISASICYTYDDESSYDDGGTSLHFYNRRDYPSLLENLDYERVLEVSELVKLKRSWDIKQDFRKNAGVKNIPASIKQQLGRSSGIWLDKKNNKIGFAGQATCIIYDIDTIDHFEIDNVLPAKGPGYAMLGVYLINDHHYIFEADTHEIDPYAAILENWTQKKVAIPEAYYNC